METLVFVYGTLKTGFYNYETYLKPAIALGKAEMVGAARTANAEFHMVLDVQVFYPLLYRAPTEGYRVCGEVYRVDFDTLVALDVLEEVDDRLYARDDVEVDILDGNHQGQRVLCQVYLLPIFDDVPRLPKIEDYTADMNAKYDALMGDPQLKILACIYGADIISAVEGKLVEGMEFRDAWERVVGAERPSDAV